MFSASIRILSCVAALILTGCVTTSGGIENTQLTWERSYLDLSALGNVESCSIHSVPDSLRPRCLENLAKLKVPDADRKPVIIWLTGCGGRFRGDEVQTFTELGLVVVAPDTNARIGRNHHCNVRTAETVVLMRQNEADYALEQLLKFQWVDQNRIFLGGHSEGGRATYLHSGKGFRARIITGQDCDGGKSPAGRIPALNLRGEKDEVLHGRHVCNMGWLEKSWSAEVPGGVHSFLFDDFALDHVKRFIAQFD